MALIALSDAKAYLGVDDNIDDSELTVVVDAVNDFCDHYTDRKLAATDLVEYYDGSGLDVVPLKNYPVNSDESTIAVYIDSSRLWPEDSKVAGAYLAIRKDRGLLYYINGFFARGRQNVKVSYNAGYPAASVPNDLILAALEMTAYMWQRKMNKSWGITSTSGAGSSVAIWEKDMPSPVRAILDQYRSRR